MNFFFSFVLGIFVFSTSSFQQILTLYEDEVYKSEKAFAHAAITIIRVKFKC